jgi:hypothetical protein
MDYGECNKTPRVRPSTSALVNGERSGLRIIVSGIFPFMAVGGGILTSSSKGSEEILSLNEPFRVGE